MKMSTVSARVRLGIQLLVLLTAACLPALVSAQADPFVRGAEGLQDAITTWLTPIAIILVMVLGGMAMAGRLAWGWVIGVILGIETITRGHPQIYYAQMRLIAANVPLGG